MPVKDCQTERLIIDTAARVFFAEGRLNATTQDIADAAGLSRTLIHYYFRSKKSLVDAVVRATITEFKSNGDQILASSAPFREKTERFIDDFLKNQSRYPYLEAFITTRKIKEGSDSKSWAVHHKRVSEPMKSYLREIEDEMSKGTIPLSNPVHFLMNMFSLMAYPVLMKQMYKGMLGIGDEQYLAILRERKQLIINMLFPDMGKKSIKIKD